MGLWLAGAFVKIYRNGKVVPALGTWESDGVCEQTAKAGACSSSSGTESHPSGTTKARRDPLEHSAWEQQSKARN